MLKWIAGLFGGAELELPDGVPAEWADRVESLFAPLNKSEGTKGRDGLGRDMLSYVLHGEPRVVLGEVAQRTEVAERLGLTGFQLDRNGQTDIYEHFDHLPNDVALRWARLLESAVLSQRSRCAFLFPSGVIWPEVLLMHCAGRGFSYWSSERPMPRSLSIDRLEALLEHDGQDASALITAAFNASVASSYGVNERTELVLALDGYAEALHRHVDKLRTLILANSVTHRLHVLHMLSVAESRTLDQLIPQLCELSVSSSKQVRSATESLLRRCDASVFDSLRRYALEGKPEQRLHSLRTIATLGASRKLADWIDFVRVTARADKAPSVQELVKELTLDVSGDNTEVPTLEFDLPQIDWSATGNAPSPAVLDSFWRDIDASIEAWNTHAREWHAKQSAQGHNFPLHQREPIAARERSMLADYLQSDEVTPPKHQQERRDSFQLIGPAIQKLVDTGELTPVATLKMLAFFGLLAEDRGLLHAAKNAFNALHRKTGRPTLLELSLMLDEVGHSGQALLRDYCYSWGSPFASDWPDTDVWPYFAHHMDYLVQVLTQNTIKDYWFSRTGLFRAIATLPAPPPAAINALFSVALGSAKTDREPAQEALKQLPGKEERIVAALEDGKAEARAIAAQWLGRLRYASALPALERAVSKEKNDVAKGALLDALQLLGQPVEKYLDRRALAIDAEKSLSKGLPADLGWFPWDALPTVRWADDATPVPTDVLRWLLVQAVKQKTPEPNAVLRKYCSMFEAADREALGQFVLENWLREDTRPITSEEAMSRAKSVAQSTHQSMTQYAQYYQNDPNLGKSVEELTAQYLPSLLRQPAGSAIASKGLLAVAAACCAERAATPTQRYLKDWYGTRAAQGKALIAMLAWIEHPSATQLMLAIGSRFRTKSFQEEATRQAEAMAERKGWTLAELADRTIPSAGFDEGGQLELSYGQRVFTAKLLPDFKVELFNPDGKKIASLPEPRQDDDSEQAKESKKAFGSAKKELKSIADLQTDRLYEALCTERDWPFADWCTYLQQHPVMRHLTQRLVWVEILDLEGGRSARRCFRPLDDGTLTDVEDNEVKLADDARVCLAHDSLLDASEVAAWQQHLADYEITPLFQQLGKGTYQLPADKAQLDEVKDFEGHMLETFALRGRALKLGYTRGAAEDAGWFFAYEKRFPTLGLQAAIEFTGNGLPEENRLVALRNLSFASTSGGDRWQRSKLPLSKVPKVLLSECYNDLRLIAAEGTGFDPEWEKKSEY